MLCANSTKVGLGKGSLSLYPSAKVGDIQVNSFLSCLMVVDAPQGFSGLVYTINVWKDEMEVA